MGQFFYYKMSFQNDLLTFYCYWIQSYGPKIQILVKNQSPAKGNLGHFS